MKCLQLNKPVQLTTFKNVSVITNLFSFYKSSCIVCRLCQPLPFLGKVVQNCVIIRKAVWPLYHSSLVQAPPVEQRVSSARTKSVLHQPLHQVPAPERAAGVGVGWQGIGVMVILCSVLLRGAHRPAIFRGRIHQSKQPHSPQSHCACARCPAHTALCGSAQIECR